MNLYKLKISISQAFEWRLYIQNQFSLIRNIQLSLQYLKDFIEFIGNVGKIIGKIICNIFMQK